ncbi:MAG TPA: hypothetical protein VFT72_20895 [Opitutaceae bacterium]|nr:hypothetical protein [Opitutaceae bacterium]
MRRLLCFLASIALPSVALAWDYAGHRAVNLLALESLPASFPKFVQADEAKARIGFLAGEPDRWRNTNELTFKHVNGPDHYLDLDDVVNVGFTPETLTEFRYVFVAQLAEARATHPERFHRIDPARNKDHTRDQIGFLPWAIVENYAKLKSTFSYLKTFQENGGTPEEIANAEANAIYIMGVMGHYVGDAAQPLHNTHNANGWIDENPKGYTKSNKFHAWIDGGFFAQTGGITAEQLKSDVHPARLISTKSKSGNTQSVLFAAVIAYLKHNYALVEPLYELDKSGDLSPENPKKGRAFLENQIVFGAEMLGSLWYTAWHDAPTDDYVKKMLDERKR